MGDVVFRRINGRIVPIKMNKNQKQRAQGAAAIGAGVAAVGAADSAAGFYFGRQLKRSLANAVSSTQINHMAKTQKAVGYSGAGLLKRAKLFSQSSKIRFGRAHISSKNISRVGHVAGAALAGYGVSKIVDSYNGSQKQNSMASELGSHVVGAALVGAGAYVFRRFSKRGIKGVKSAQLAFKGI